MFNAKLIATVFRATLIYSIALVKFCKLTMSKRGAGAPVAPHLAMPLTI